MHAGSGDLLDLVAQMEDFAIVPNTASFNLVLKAMYQGKDTGAAEKLLQRMLLSGKDTLPNDESYDFVIGMLFSLDQIDAALKYLFMALKSGYMLSMRVFNECVWSCVNKKKLDALVSIIKKCEVHD